MYSFKIDLANYSRTRPLFTNCSRTNPFLDFLVDSAREQFAKVRKHCSPNHGFRLSGEHCSWTVCQSSWTVFTKPWFWAFWWTLFVNSLPKFVNSVHQTQSVTRFGEHCSRTVFTWLITKVFTNFLVNREHCASTLLILSTLQAPCNTDPCY